MPKPDDRDASADLRARLEKLQGQIRERAPGAPGGEKGEAAWNSAMSAGLQAGSEFIAAILVGGAIGWGLDWLLRTKPAFTIVFFLLGVAAGVWNVIRATSPKGAREDRNSRLSDAKADAKDVPRVGPSGGDEDED